MSAPPHRRTLLLVFVVLPLIIVSGCLGPLKQTQPSGSCTEKRLTPAPYPDRPATLSTESVRTFVADLERAYVYAREASDGDVVNVSFDPEPDEVTRLEDGWSVRIETGFSQYTCLDGSLAVGDGYYTARYFLNESAIYRAQDGGAGPVADPREQGTRIHIANRTQGAIVG